MSNKTQTAMASQFEDVGTQREFGYALRDFLDQFRFQPDRSLLLEEPALLEARLQDSGVADAYLASTAAWLCHRHGFLVPEWAKSISRTVNKPFFAAKTPKLRAILLQESPTEFRLRNLFVSANALHRA